MVENVRELGKGADTRNHTKFNGGYFVEEIEIYKLEVKLSEVSLLEKKETRAIGYK
jgi:hypothetical protein